MPHLSHGGALKHKYVSRTQQTAVLFSINGGSACVFCDSSSTHLTVPQNALKEKEGPSFVQDECIGIGSQNACWLQICDFFKE